MRHLFVRLGVGFLAVGAATAQQYWFVPRGVSIDLVLAAAAPGVDSAVPTWITDSSIYGGGSSFLSPGQSGTPAIHGTSVLIARVALNVGGIVGLPTPLTTGSVLALPQMLGCRVGAAFIGTTFAAHFMADSARVPVSVVFGGALAPPIGVPLLRTLWWLGAQAATVVTGTTDANG